jgi:hypothetical protein
MSSIISEIEKYTQLINEYNNIKNKIKLLENHDIVKEIRRLRKSLKELSENKSDFEDKILQYLKDEGQTGVKYDGYTFVTHEKKMKLKDDDRKEHINKVMNDLNLNSNIKLELIKAFDNNIEKKQILKIKPNKDSKNK